MGYGTTPSVGDSDNVLLFKIAQFYSDSCPAADAAPALGDSKNTLLRKILQCLSVC